MYKLCVALAAVLAVAAAVETSTSAAPVTTPATIIPSVPLHASSYKSIVPPYYNNFGYSAFPGAYSGFAGNYPGYFPSSTFSPLAPIASTYSTPLYNSGYPLNSFPASLPSAYPSAFPYSGYPYGASPFIWKKK